jgi:N-acetylglucosamine-6-phosphate deacetylase
VLQRCKDALHVSHLVLPLHSPEVEGAHDTLNELRDEIIFSMGHTVATFEEANEAVESPIISVFKLWLVQAAPNTPGLRCSKGVAAL